MKPCSHVVCKTCVDELVRPPVAKNADKPKSACVVCDVALKDKDIIELKREGMAISYAAHLLSDALAQVLVLQAAVLQKPRRRALRSKGRRPSAW